MTIGRRAAGERKTSRSRHIRIVFQTRPSLSRSVLRLFLLVPRERAFSRLARRRRLPCPRRRTTRRSRGFLSSARRREIRVLLLRFSRTRLSYRGLFLSSSPPPPPPASPPFLPLRLELSLSLSSLSFSLPRLPFRLSVSFLFCVL